MSTWDRIAELPLTIERYELEDRRREFNGFTRATTTIHLLGGGEEGLGEDVVYDAADHDAAQAAGPVQPLGGEWTIASFCDHVAGLRLFETTPKYEASDLYRRWAYESAALDLALRQAGQPLHAVLGREPRPLTFVNSLRGLGRPPSLAPVTARLERYPRLRLKIDATSQWDEELFAALRDTGAVDSVDLKGFYRDTPVDQPASSPAGSARSRRCSTSTTPATSAASACTAAARAS
jgi:L-alanine-DL-glutamate epimerase-like enolase superfamily enzyme